MANLRWLESFHIGVPEIDDDHKAILALIQKIETVIRASRYDACRPLLNDLVALVEAHFRREEGYLREIGYPYIEEHIDYHHGLFRKIRSVKAICADIGNTGEFEACFDAMADFLIDDIIKGDLVFKSYLQAVGVLP